jgi:hypothetical protein
LELQAIDVCLLCGQAFLYGDINDVRRKFWNGQSG